LLCARANNRHHELRNSDLGTGEEQWCSVILDVARGKRATPVAVNKRRGDIDDARALARALCKAQNLLG
jgi:hypothetical protein